MSKQAPTTLNIPEKREGESDRAYLRRLSAFISGADVRTKTDLADWTGSYPFHLDRPTS